MLVYAKQIIGAASQISGFARRIEFPRMVQAVTGNPRIPVGTLVGIQKISFAIAGAIAAAVLVASLIIISLFDGFTQQAWAFLAFFCVTILTEAYGQSLVQAMFARNLFHSAAVARITAVVVAIGFGYLFVAMIGAKVFIVSDLISHAIVISLSYHWLRRNFARHGHA
jgi:predicted neutral ceramidase superfamily lipid hydrolase